jgi:hypothetical protein
MKDQFAQQQQMYAQPVAPQRRMVPFFSEAGGRAVDPLNIYSLPNPQRQQQNQQYQNNQPFRQQPQNQQNQQPAPNMDHLNMLLGYDTRINPQTGKKRKVLNLFTNRWE